MLKQLNEHKPVGISINTAYIDIDVLYKVYTKMAAQDLEMLVSPPTKAYKVCAVYIQNYDHVMKKT